ncbi:MAG: hypothetical protein CW716_06300 [Candidatus Bathyarchaeum sp.]|nr:MAG: hypothetical protein CW716_06300 [Candidatus Bathyarchaeum sp.]
MNKMGFVSLIIVVTCFLTATALGMQNGTVPEQPQEKPEPPELARDAALDYILQTHAELVTVQLPTDWEMENLTPGILGASHLQFTSGGWTVTVSYAVVLEPTYSVEVNHTCEINFQWSGTVSQNGAAVETSFSVA